MAITYTTLGGLFALKYPVGGTAMDAVKSIDTNNKVVADSTLSDGLIFILDAQQDFTAAENWNSFKVSILDQYPNPNKITLNARELGSAPFTESDLNGSVLCAYYALDATNDLFKIYFRRLNSRSKMLNAARIFRMCGYTRSDVISLVTLFTEYTLGASEITEFVKPVDYITEDGTRTDSEGTVLVKGTRTIHFESVKGLISGTDYIEPPIVSKTKIAQSVDSFLRSISTDLSITVPPLNAWIKYGIYNINYPLTGLLPVSSVITTGAFGTGSLKAQGIIKILNASMCGAGDTINLGGGTVITARASGAVPANGEFNISSDTDTLREGIITAINSFTSTTFVATQHTCEEILVTAIASGSVANFIIIFIPAIVPVSLPFSFINVHGGAGTRATGSIVVTSGTVITNGQYLTFNAAETPIRMYFHVGDNTVPVTTGNDFVVRLSDTTVNGVASTIAEAINNNVTLLNTYCYVSNATISISYSIAGTAGNTYTFATNTTGAFTLTNLTGGHATNIPVGSFFYVEDESSYYAYEGTPTPSFQRVTCGFYLNYNLLGSGATPIPPYDVNKLDTLMKMHTVLSGGVVDYAKATYTLLENILAYLNIL